MVDGAAIQAKLTAVLTRADLKRSVVVEHNEYVENDFGEEIPTLSTQEVIEGITLNYNQFKKKYDVAGQYKNSSLILLLPTETVVEEQDNIIVFNQDYDIVGISAWPLGEHIVAQKVFLIEKA